MALSAAALRYREEVVSIPVAYVKGKFEMHSIFPVSAW